jgi:hypothetical protein
VERVIRKFSSFEEADKADREYYRSLTPQERLNQFLEVLEIGKSFHGAPKRLARVYRIVKLGES